MTCLVRVVSPQPLISIGPRPVPGMAWTSQSQPESVYPFHDLDSSKDLDPLPEKLAA